MTIRTVDSKGRVSLGDRFANRMVIIKETDPTELRITIACVIPEREAWLHTNTKAREAVARGIRQAKAKRFSIKPPDLASDKALIDLISDENE